LTPEATAPRSQFGDFRQTLPRIGLGDQQNGDDGSETHLTKEVKPGFEAQGTIIATQSNAGQRPIGFEVFSNLLVLLGLSRRQFKSHKRSQLFLCTRNEPVTGAAMSVSNPDCSPRHPALLRLSTMAS
jgi:hypothetical protein